jgi:hypothetical protein
MQALRYRAQGLHPLHQCRLCSSARKACTHLPLQLLHGVCEARRLPLLHTELTAQKRSHGIQSTAVVVHLGSSELQLSLELQSSHMHIRTHTVPRGDTRGCQFFLPRNLATHFSAYG